MNITTFFIKRPIATSLFALGVALAGIIAFNLLPVSSLPEVDFPTISVSASLPGANPENMATSVATPLERQLGKIAGVTEMTSSSTLGQTRITLQFDLSRNIDGAARDVQAAINASLSQLPSNLPSNPTYRKVNPADAPIMILALTSDVYDKGQLYDFASTILAQKLSQVDGVGQVVVGGSSLPGVRVELNPTQLNSYGIGLTEVAAALAAANVNTPKGQLQQGTTQTSLQTTDQLFKASQYESVIITYVNNSPVRVSDVAQVVDSVEDLRNAGISNGKPAVLIVLYKEPAANVISTVDQVRAIMPFLKGSLPAAVNLSVALDRTTTIRTSLFDVEMTLIIAMILVVFVTYLFLGNIHSMIIPGVAVLLSILGTFGLMKLLGYSLDNLSMMALTISTGFVVDDAVVVLENITRHLENGLTPKQAALKGAEEVSFTVLSMSLSLIAVFLPILLMSGLVGRLFHEFAVTLSVAILVSLFISLSVTPVMCSIFLVNNGNANNHNRYKQAVEKTRQHYDKTLAWVLDHPFLMQCVMIATIILTIYLFITIPKGFFPQQDTGRISASIQADQNISFQAMKNKLDRFADIVKKDPAVENVVGFLGSGVGNNTTNAGSLFITLKPLAERGMSVDQVINRLRGQLADVPGATLYMQAAQDLVVGGRLGNAQYQYTLSADDLTTLNYWAPRVTEQLRKTKGMVDVNSDQLSHGLQAYVKVDRDAASQFGLTTQLIDSTLYNAFGQSQVSTMYTAMNQYHVVMEVAPPFWQYPETLNQIYVISPSGQQVPLSAFASFDLSTTLLSVNHQGLAPAATISFNLPTGRALGDAVMQINHIINEMHLPASMHGTFQGTAQAFEESLANETYLIMAALLAVYIVLGILYESLIHPITILSTLPSAGVGALLALMLAKTDLSIIALIGVILLIGIVKKNAIMMIDFALHAERNENKSSRDSIYEAATLRFRPIMMTTFAAIFGAMPLVLGYGLGSELRRPLGIAIVGGLIMSQLLTLYTTPVMYLTFEKIRTKLQMLAVSVMCLFLSACLVGPDYHRPSVDVPNQFKEAKNKKEKWKVAEPKDACHRGEWWNIFHDKKLSELENQLGQSNQSIATAYANYQQTLAVVDEARANFYPVLTGSASLQRQKSSATFVTSGTSGSSTTSGGSAASSTAVYSHSISFNASWQPDIWGLVRRTVEADRSAAQASEALLAATRLSSQASLATFYFELRALDKDQKILNATVKSNKKILSLTRHQYDSGVASRADILQAQSQFESSQAAAINNKVNRAVYEHAIAVLIGVPASNFSIPYRPLNKTPPRIPVAVPSTLLERRPDVAQAERLMAQANAQIGVAVAAYFPAITLSANNNFFGQGRSHWLSLSQMGWAYGPTLSETILDGGLRSATVRAAQYGYQSTVASYRQIVLAAFQNVEDNLATLRILTDEAVVQNRAVVTASRALKFVVNEYKAGTVPYSSVLSSQLALYTAEKNAADITGQRMTAAVGLIVALGGGWDAGTDLR